ncbi:hypothetical protein BCR44DRAFT_43348 [Catenaria anguillulae PL171]|uniref:TauD/TfdA-like domain-containing protein n=1 Tax=Catenaria anguillulae PL171 TaxID=765915 RepID=A0A1Y2H618_9FUNG|nr:hypothetical protein BCR44DRAFT_43348 [Catenaria anguillulae PL171]
MYYAPPFQGPLMPPPSGDVSWASDPHVVKAWYKGMRAWDEHVRRQKMVMIDLKPGDAVLFQNRRVLHGRTAFDSVQDGVGAGEKAVRHLRGCYVDWDEFLDRWRVSRYREVNGLKV